MKSRLDKALQSQGFGTRKACRLLVNRGAVRVNGVLADDPDADVECSGMVLSIEGVEWRWHETIYLALNKPEGVECSHTPTHHKSVFSLLPEPFVTRGVQCVGRLDADTTGLLLLSDDGSFIQQLTSPKRKVAKTYLVTCAEPVTDAQLSKLAAGVTLSDAPEAVAGEGERVSERVLRLTIHEGKYHQVKRMVTAAGNHVVSLHRQRVGGLELPVSLASGQWVVLDEPSLAAVRGG
ncbi:MAG: 16S rRNA pseudouridine(516) synthase [Myxococcales bacterium]|nr:16S rRNA pseudouridine(516) synthase [Myxococcales bacterium]